MMVVSRERIYQRKENEFVHQQKNKSDFHCPFWSTHHCKCPLLKDIRMDIHNQFAPNDGSSNIICQSEKTIKIKTKI